MVTAAPPGTTAPRRTDRCTLAILALAYRKVPPVVQLPPPHSYFPRRKSQRGGTIHRHCFANNSAGRRADNRSSTSAFNIFYSIARLRFIDASDSFRSFAGFAPSCSSSNACLVTPNRLSVRGSAFQQCWSHLPRHPSRRPCLVVLMFLRNMPLLDQPPHPAHHPKLCRGIHQFASLTGFLVSVVRNLRVYQRYRT